MKRRAALQFIRHDDWAAVIGGPVQIRRHGLMVQSGIVEDATVDSSILWLRSSGVQPRRAFVRREGYEVWISPRDLQPGTRQHV
ncbi:hypothetical protein [Arthrobacter sp. S39]|uniref:hypothetical protein n=1 Tax=Arthrobacter sp. S39 TaxID=2509720 RepID=UPI00103734E4|nr:hypothetical protein [Arthrobacter sp. S39]TAP38804.1 hypothetical protein EYS21_23065 [Arthrobacter sp. S39]